MTIKQIHLRDLQDSMEGGAPMVVIRSWQYRIRPLILSCSGIISVSLGACQSSFLQQPLALDQDDLVKLMENKDCPGCNLVGAGS